MKHTVPHDLDAATARRVVEHAFDAYRERFSKYSPTMRWATPAKAVIAFSARGIALEGSMELVDHAVAIELEVPLLLRPLRGAALEVIEREVRKWVAKAKTETI